MTPTPEQFAALLDEYVRLYMRAQVSFTPKDKSICFPSARTAVLDAYAQALDSAGQLRAERNNLQSKINHMTDDRDSYAQARAGGAVKVPDDLRAEGWAVAVHNDYRLNGQPHTFWLFTKNGRCVKGEGRTDDEALNACRAEVLRLNGETK